jgi:myo-inositol 2-dehydrogenase/D-chiro-inositol 1-dehydrogenase
VCELGTVALGDGSPVVLRKDGLRSDQVPQDYRERFRRAYDAEMQEWVRGFATGEVTGPSSWDGYAATAVGDACLQAMATGERVAVSMQERPAFYQEH